MKTFETVFFFNGKMKAEIKMICNCQVNVHTKEIYIAYNNEKSPCHLVYARFMYINFICRHLVYNQSTLS